MRKVECESCSHVQSQTWKTGDLCTECGGAVRAEIACAWCCHSVPAQKFCRDCGFEMVSPDHFGVARMLKASQIDKLSLPQKIREMEPDHIDHYRAMFNRDYSLLDTRIEEMRLAESFLLHKDYSFKFQTGLLEKLPFDDDTKAFLKDGPTGSFENRPERLAEIAEFSPIGQTRWLAMLAMAREPQHEHNFYAEVYSKLKDAFLKGEDASVKSEALAGLSYWKMLPQVLLNAGYSEDRVMDRGLERHMRSDAPMIWDELSAYQKPYIAPILGLLEWEDSRFGQEVSQTLEASKIHTHKDVAFASQLSARNGNALWERLRNAKAAPSDQDFVANFVIARFQLPQTYEVLTSKHTALQKDMLENLLRRAGAEFETYSDSILRGFLKILDQIEESNLKSRVFNILAKSAYASDAIRKTVANPQAFDRAAALKSLKTNPSDAQTVLEAFAQGPLTEDIIRHISDSVKGYSLGSFWINKLWDYALLQSLKTQTYFALPNLLRNILNKSDADARHLLILFLRDMMNAPAGFEDKKETPPALSLILDVGTGDFTPKYLSQDGQVIVFSPTPKQLSSLVDNLSELLEIMAGGIGILEPDMARRFFQRIWTPHQPAWIESAAQFPDITHEFNLAFQTLVLQSEQGEFVRCQSLKALLALAPHLDEKQQTDLKTFTLAVPKPEGGMFYLLERLGA